jgi:hypothetical protein
MAVALAACASSKASSLNEAPLSINYVWPPEAHPVYPEEPRVPDEIDVTWRPDAFAADDIQDIANQHCETFHRAARPIAPPSPSPPLLIQRFACVETAGKHQ